MQKERQKKPGKKRSAGVRLFRLFYTIIMVLSAIIVAGYCFVTYGIRPPEVETPPQTTTAVTTAPEDQDSQHTDAAGDTAALERREQVYTCLIMGSDDGNGNADTIMVATFDVPNQTIGLVSIPRDTYVDVNRKVKKINAAYSAGGVDEVRTEVSELLGIPIDFYVKIELSAFEKLVNAIGGVYFDVPVSMDYEDPYQDLYIHVKKGYQLLDGEQAMGVVRCRSVYASQDLGRINTQQAFMKAMLKQIASSVSVSNIGTIVDIISKYVKTDVSMDNMLYFAKAALTIDIDNAMRTSSMPGEWHSPYLWLSTDEALDVINTYLNPYTTPVTADMTDIVERN